MRKNIITISAIAIASLALPQSCNIDTFRPSDETFPTSGETSAGRTITITAALESGDTKTQLKDGSKVVWTAGDQIKVFTATDKTGSVFTLNAASDGQSTGTFTGTVSGDGPYYAIYPASLGNSFDGSQINFTIPSAQTYSAGSFPEEANIAVAYGEDKDALSFRNAFGILCLPITGSGTVSKIAVTSKADENLSGTGLVSMDYGEDGPSVSTYYYSSKPEEKSVTLNCNGVQLSSTATRFYIVIPNGKLADGFSVEVFDADNNSMIKSAQASDSNKIVRSTLTTMPEFAYAAQYSSAIHNTTMGIYSGAKAGETPKTHAQYTDATQYAISTESDGARFRIQNWDVGYAVQLSKIPTSPSSGDTFTMKVTIMGDAAGFSTSKSELSTTVLKAEDKTLWLIDEEDNCYVMMLP